MEANKLWALRINRKDLVKDLCIEEIKDHMISCDDIMDADDFEKIYNSGKNRKERASAFLDFLVRSEPAAFGHFCDALQTKQRYLSQKLKEDAEMLAKKVGRGAWVEIDAMTLQAILKENDRLKQDSQELKQLQCEHEALQHRNDRIMESLSRARKRSEELAEEGETMKSQHGENSRSINTLLQVVSESNKQKEEAERDVEGLEERLYQMEERLNIKEEQIKSLQEEKLHVEGRALQEHRMVNNLRGQIDTMKKDLQLMEQDVARLRKDRNAARKAADERGHEIQRLHYDLKISQQLKKNCESVIRHLNGSVQSKEYMAQQAQADLCNLLEQYLNFKQTAS